jgi:hypothetical protein
VQLIINFLTLFNDSNDEILINDELKRKGKRSWPILHNKICLEVMMKITKSHCVDCQFSGQDSNPVRRESGL